MEGLYEYDWRDGRITLNWLAPTVALLRAHESEAQIPGPYNCVMTVHVQEGQYEIMGFLGKRPDIRECRKVYEYLDSLGLKKHYRRFKEKHDAD